MANLGSLCLAGVLLAWAGDGETATQDPQVRADLLLLQQHGLPSDGSGLSRHLRGFILSEEDRKLVADLVQQLGDPQFRVRQKAQHDVMQLGSAAVPFLRKALAAGDLELQRRAQRCLKDLDERYPCSLTEAVIRLLPVRRPAGVAKLLFDYLPCAGDSLLREEVLEALVKLGRDDPQAEQILERALKSPLWEHRAAAGFVLGAEGSLAQKERVRGLLADDQAEVRFWTARGLLIGGDPRAVATLVELLRDAGPAARRAAQVLGAMAGPEDGLSGVPEQNYQAWKSWWEKNGASVRVPAACRYLEIGPSSRARTLAGRFLDTLLRGDFATLRKTCTTPFSLAGLIVLKDSQDFTEAFTRLFLERTPERKGSQVTVLHCEAATAYCQAAPEADRAFLGCWQMSQVRVVHVRVRFPDQRTEEGVIYAVFDEGSCHVIGIGQSSRVAANR